MIKQVFVIHDSKAEAFLQPFFADKEALAIRMFENAISDPASDFHKYAEDYSLFEIGTYNDNTGMITHQDPIRSIINAVSLRKATPLQLVQPQEIESK